MSEFVSVVRVAVPHVAPSLVPGRDNRVPAVAGIGPEGLTP